MELRTVVPKSSKRRCKRVQVRRKRLPLCLKVSINVIITARKRSLLRLCFYRCLSVHGGGVRGRGGMRGCGGHAWLLGLGHAWLWGLGHASLRGACIVVAGVCVSAGGCTWLWGAYVFVGGMHGGRGACMVAAGHAWWQGGMRGIRRDTVNEQAVRILLECILV